MDANECAALVARVRDGGFLTASESDIGALCDALESTLANRRQSDAIAAAIASVSEHAQRAGRLEAQLEALRAVNSVEYDRFDSLAELVGDAVFRVGRVDISAVDFKRGDSGGWGVAWRDALDELAMRMESAEYLEQMNADTAEEASND